MFSAVIICIILWILLYVCFNPVCLFIIISSNAFDVALMFILLVCGCLFIFKLMSLSS